MLDIGYSRTSRRYGILDMVLCTHLPGMTVMVPSSYQELQVMLEDAMEITNGPVSIRWSKTRRSDQFVLPVMLTWPMQSAFCLSVVCWRQRRPPRRNERRGSGRVRLGCAVCKTLDPEMIAHAAYHRGVVTVKDGISDGLGLSDGRARGLTSPASSWTLSPA